jgi:acetyl-CoA acetyltransferase
MTASDIELWELNEAFSSVVLTFMDALNIPHERINVNGGAIAMGHPLGASGAMILGTALDELERTRQDHRSGQPVRGRRHGLGDGHRTRLTHTHMNTEVIRCAVDADGIAC